MAVSRNSTQKKNSFTRSSMVFQQPRMVMGVMKVTSSTRNRLMPSIPMW